jgi:metal-responsive CopG/Arc/MetJ family transcriptional regulator
VTVREGVRDREREQETERECVCAYVIAVAALVSVAHRVSDQNHTHTTFVKCFRHRVTSQQCMYVCMLQQKTKTVVKCRRHSVTLEQSLSSRDRLVKGS